MLYILSYKYTTNKLQKQIYLSKPFKNILPMELGFEILVELGYIPSKLVDTKLFH